MDSQKTQKGILKKDDREMQFKTRTARACNARYEENNDKEHASENELEKTRMRWVCNFKTDKEKREMVDIRLIISRDHEGKE